MSKAPPRPSMSQARRLRIWERDGGVCYLCMTKVLAGEKWDAEHVLAWALSFDDSDDNLKVAHKDGCHAAKTKVDVKRVSKAKRQGGETGQAARRAKNGSQLKGRPFPKGPKKKWPSRSFRR